MNALLARFYLQHGRWSEALQYASDVLTSGDVGLEEGMDEVFTAGSSENIWILEEDVQGLSIALYFLQPFSNGLYVVRPREPIGFDMGDARRNVSISASGNTIIKYTGIFSNNDPLYLMRLPEVYLIAAEAAIMANNDFEAAAEYLNALRERAGLAEVILNAGNYEALLAHERNAELCYEGFHRFMDLKRWGQDQEVLGPYGYEERDALWPIPQLFLDVFKSVEQNPGY